MKIITAVLFVGAQVAGVALADAGNEVGLPIWLASAFFLGWITRSPWSVLLAFLAVPIAVPFGYPEEWGTGHDPLPLWFGALLAAPVQAAIVILGREGRYLYERFARGPVQPG